jgi:hypothetical protein
MKRVWKPSPEVVRRAAVALCEAEVRQLRAEYEPLQARVLAGDLDDELCDRHCEAGMRFYDAVERLDEARNGRAVTWPDDQGEPIGLALIPMPTALF